MVCVSRRFHERHLRSRRQAYFLSILNIIQISNIHISGVFACKASRNVSESGGDFAEVRNSWKLLAAIDLKVLLSHGDMGCNRVVTAPFLLQCLRRLLRKPERMRGAKPESMHAARGHSLVASPAGSTGRVRSRS